MLAILQARTSSHRLPGKVLRSILGAPMLSRQVERLRRARLLTGVVLATSTDASDDPLQALGEQLGLPVHRGSLDDVLDRFMGALAAAGRPEAFLRLTADCPLADPEAVDGCIARFGQGNLDYVHNSPGGWPKGTDVEVCRTGALEAAWRESQDRYDREHVTPFVYRRPERFRLAVVARETPEPWRWTVDTAEDLAFVTEVYEALYPRDPAFTTEDVLAWQRANPGKARRA